jgi:hypothetical protein
LEELDDDNGSFADKGDPVLGPNFNTNFEINKFSKLEPPFDY